MPLRIIKDGAIMVSTIEVSDIIEYYEEKMRDQDIKVEQIYISKSMDEWDEQLTGLCGNVPDNKSWQRRVE